MNELGSVLSGGNGSIINLVFTTSLLSIQQKVDLKRNLQSYQPLS